MYLTWEIKKKTQGCRKQKSAAAKRTAFIIFWHSFHSNSALSSINDRRYESWNLQSRTEQYLCLSSITLLGKAGEANNAKRMPEWSLNASNVICMLTSVCCFSVNFQLKFDILLQSKHKRSEIGSIDCETLFGVAPPNGSKGRLPSFSLPFLGQFCESIRSVSCND